MEEKEGEGDGRRGGEDLCCVCIAWLVLLSSV